MEQFFHTVGSIAEAREVIRRIVEQKIPWDQVEIIASDKEMNAAAVYTVAAASHIPCTFAGGLPISVTNAGRAAKLYMEWMESGFNLDPILTALKQGIIRLRDDQLEDAEAGRLIRELEQSGIGWGRERYRLLTSLLKTENKLLVTQSEIWERSLKARRRYHEFSFMTTREIAESGSGGGVVTLLRGVIDLVFEEEDGWVIVDFKTDRYDLELKQQFVEFYKPQVQAYVEEWERTVGGKVKEAGLCFIESNRYVVGRILLLPQ